MAIRIKLNKLGREKSDLLLKFLGSTDIPYEEEDDLPEILRPQSIEEYNKEIDEAIAEYEAGNYYTMEQVEGMLNEAREARKQ